MEGWLSGEATDERVHLLMRVRIPHLPQINDYTTSTAGYSETAKLARLQPIHSRTRGD